MKNQILFADYHISRIGFYLFWLLGGKRNTKKTAKEVQGVQIKTKEFQRVVGWLSKDSVLLQTKNLELRILKN